MSSLFAELKRRKVIRVAVVYAATAFVVLQAADIMLPRLAVPDWAMTLVVVFAVLGFPIALVLGWALEVTPDGIRRTDAVPAGQAAQGAPGETPALLGKRTLIVAGVLVVLGIGLSAGWLLKPGAPGPFEPAAVVEPGPATVPAGTDDERQPKSMPAAERESIAVLPFVNMSPDPENAYFADGISEELLNILAGIEGLKVASRTSAFSFKGSNTPIPEIARQLGVRHVPWSILMSAWLPAMQWLREDPRYFQLMERRGRVEYWDSYGYPRDCRPVDDPAGRRLDCKGNAQ